MLNIIVMFARGY